MYADVARFVGHVDIGGHGERVHIGAPGHHAAGLRSLEQCDDPMLADAGLHFIHAEGAKFFGDHSRGALFPIRKLGMLVEIAALRDDGVAQGIGRRRDPLGARLTG